MVRARFHTYMVAPGLPSNRLMNKKVGIAAIHPDFRAAKPLSLMECAGRIPEQPHELFGSLCELGPPATVLPVLPSPIDRLSNLSPEGLITFRFGLALQAADAW